MRLPAQLRSRVWLPTLSSWRASLYHFIRSLGWRRVLPVVLMLLGFSLLGFVGYEYFDLWTTQRNLNQRWEQENQQQVGVAPKVVNDGLTRLQIPKIDVDAIVVEGTSSRALRVGPGRLKDSAHPGDKGNSVITAHRDTFFRHIYQLSKGDEILVRRNGEVMRFEVTAKRIVKPSDVSVLKQTKDPQLTLITCYPTYYIGPAPERLVVFSKMIERAPNVMAATGAPRASR